MFDETYFRPDSIVTEIQFTLQERYRNIKRLAKKAGCKTMNGLGMMLFQGDAAFTYGQESICRSTI